MESPPGSTAELPDGYKQAISDGNSGNDVAVANREKTQRIIDACNSRNIKQLKTLAETDGGFLTDSLRRQAC
jgi:hypothetical protein